jgi:surface antigen
MTGLYRSIVAAFALAASVIAAVPATATGYLQCVPFARAESGVQLFGNARDWWHMADGRYNRGQTPRVGAVMAFAPTRAMPIGHVAVVSQIVSDRELRISHANWSPINGRRGQIERNVRVIDVSAAGDWSAVRVWYAPIGDLGLRVNPIRGFIYPGDGAVPGGNRPSSRDIAAIIPDADGTLAAIVRSVGR